MNIGVTGFTGRLGSYLIREGCFPIQADIRDAKSLNDAGLNQFDAIINCAANTDVDRCQTPPGIKNPDYENAVEVNVRGVEKLRSAYLGRLIHLSSDYVFKGNKGPYKETDERNPVNDYGFTKYGGEVVLETFPTTAETVIVRTTGLFGNGRDFAQYALNTLRNGEVVLAAHDLVGNHTYIPHLAVPLLMLAEIVLPERLNYLHLASLDRMSRFHFATKLAETFGLRVDKVYGCKATTIANWVAPRPTNGGMSVSKALDWGLPMYTTEQGLKAYRETEG